VFDGNHTSALIEASHLMDPRLCAKLAPVHASSSDDEAAIRDVLASGEPITLAEMDSVALQDRVDMKYVMTTRQLYAALAALGRRYRVLEIEQTRVHPYRTLYFDTPKFDLYMHHHAGRCNRYKVRSRTYEQTRASFFEVKHKTNKDRTQKQRMSTPQMVMSVCAEAQQFVDAHLPPHTRELQPTLHNTFSRITLVSRHCAERLTLDLNIRFGLDQCDLIAAAALGGQAGASIALSGLAIAEVKQGGRGRTSDFARYMRGVGVREMSFSKYCVGVSMLYTHVKRNRFKPELGMVRKLIDSGSHHQD
jgi:hypothetical protein